MRNKDSILIVTWVPGNHGAGGSTIANAVGVALQHFTERRTLIVNYGSPKSYMERYMERDVDMRFSMDYLKSFGDSISAEHIKIYATPINEKLYIIPNSKISSEISMVGEKFNKRFTEESLRAFDIVIIDIESGMNQEKRSFLERADIILSVMTMNEIMLDDLYGSNGDPLIKRFLNDEKTLRLFNMINLPLDIEKELKHINNKYNLKSSFGIMYDNEMQKACCTDRKFYSFMKRQLVSKRNTAGFPEQIKDLCGIIAEKSFLTMEEKCENHSFMNTLFAKARQWGEADV